MAKPSNADDPNLLLLEGEIFHTLTEAQIVAESWRRHAPSWTAETVLTRT